MAHKTPYIPANAEVESNASWNETQDVKRHITIKTQTNYDPGEIFHIVKSGHDLPAQFTENARIQSVTVVEEVITTLTRKED